MKQLYLIILLITSYAGINAQTPIDTAVTYYYIVNLDEDLTDLFSSQNKDDGNSHEGEQIQVSDSLIASIIDTFYTMATITFKKELGLELLPLNELQGKIKYHNVYPNCPDLTNIKKVLKVSPGYDFYTDYFVNIFADVNSTTPGMISPYKVRPLYAISLTLYDPKGKLVKKINLSYKARKPLAEGKPGSKNPDSQQLKLKLCTSYSEALIEATKAYKKTPLEKSKDGVKWVN